MTDTEARQQQALNDLNGNVQRARAKRAERLTALMAPNEPKEALSTYSELAELIELLPVLVREHRRRNRLSMRAAARQIGCAPSTISRLDAGDDVSSPHIVAILRWLDGASAEPCEHDWERFATMEGRDELGVCRRCGVEWTDGL